MKSKIIAIALAVTAGFAQAGPTATSSSTSSLSWSQVYGSRAPRTIVTTDTAGNQTSTIAPTSTSGTYDQVNSLLTNKIKLYGYFTGSAVDSNGNSLIPFVVNNPDLFRSGGGSGGSGSSLAGFTNVILDGIINKSSTPVSGI